MTFKERKIFWNALNQAKTRQDTNIIKSSYTVPKKLYRYRSVNTHSLEALCENKLYFSSSDYYDDPFDTYLRIDWKKLHNVLYNLSSGNCPPTVIDWFNKNLGIQITSDSFLNLDTVSATKHIKDYLCNIRNNVRKNIWSVCFSESPLNKELWLKYANSHKGFIVEYDTYNDNLYLCGKNTSCIQCPMGNAPIPLYPIYYSSKRYDASNYACFLGICTLLSNDNSPLSQTILQQIIANDTCVWEAEKVTLIKEWEYRHDKEWRSILANTYPCPPSHSPFVKWVPSRIIFGYQMPESEKTLLNSIAQNAGITKIAQVIIDDNDKFTIQNISAPKH